MATAMIAALTQPASEKAEPSQQHRPDNGDAAASRCGNRMRGALIRAVEHVPPAQQRDQRAGCNAANQEPLRPRCRAN